MHLTGGQFKGTKVSIPKTARPTLSKVRQSVFNMLAQFEFKDYTFLDMFAGSAIMGLEAISRGYKVKEIEIDKKSAQIIKENYKKIKLNPDITIIDALKFQTNNKYEIIYIDPPWKENYTNILKKASELLSVNGLIILEFDNLNKDNVIKNEDILKSLNLIQIKEKKYGRSCISILKFFN